MVVFVCVLGAVLSLHCWAGFSCSARGSPCSGFSCCGVRFYMHRLCSRSTRAQQLWLPGSRAQAQQLWHTGLAAPQYVGSSWIKDRTRVSCVGRWILYHWATREAWTPVPWRVNSYLMLKSLRQLWTMVLPFSRQEYCSGLPFPSPGTPYNIHPAKTELTK